MVMASDCTNYQPNPLRWVVALSLVAAMAAGTLSPNIGIPYHNVDKLVHWAMFCAVGVALLGPLSFSKPGTLAVLGLLALVLEGGQVFVPGRIVDLGDLIANLFGILCAFALIGMPFVMRRDDRVAKTDGSLLYCDRSELDDMILPSPQSPLVTAILLGNGGKAADCRSTEKTS
jgi:VanZ family protein